MIKNASRIKWIYAVFFLLFFAIGLRISYLQIFRSSFFRSLSQNQYYRLLRLEGKRGKIIDCRGRILGTGIGSYSVFVDPVNIENPQSTAQLLSSHLDLSYEEIYEKLKKKRRFIWIKRKISWADKEKIDNLKLKGTGFIKEEQRFWPQGFLAGDTLGRVDIDNKGLEGLELIYDNFLRGKNGWVRVLQESASREIVLSPHTIDPQSGADLMLTLDSQIQYWAESYLKKTVADFRARGGSVLVMDAPSGEIIALANHYPQEPPYIKNQAVCDMFEPGSVFKVVTLLAAIEEGTFYDEDTFFCEKGKFKIPGSILHDWKPYGTLTFREVFKKSSNIGVGKIAYRLGKRVMYQYIRKFGFGEKTGVDLPGEARGMLKPSYQWSKTAEYIVPIGQGIGVNLLQLVRVFAAVANGGYLVTPHLVQSIQFPSFYKEISHDNRKRVISPATAERAKSILLDVVADGTGKRAYIKGAKVGGKTGTAQKYDFQLGKYSSSKYRATFVGFVCDMDSPLVIGVSIDEPRKHHFGGVVAAPLFKEIAQKARIYLQRGEVLAER